jgi:hypothetical protein
VKPSREPLLACRREWLQSDEEWGRVIDGRPSGDVWYVQFGPKAEDVERFVGDVQVVTVMAEEWKS